MASGHDNIAMQHRGLSGVRFPDEIFTNSWIGDNPTREIRSAYMHSYFAYMTSDFELEERVASLRHAAESRATTIMVNNGWTWVPLRYFEHFVDQLIWKLFFQTTLPTPIWPWTQPPTYQPGEPESSTFATLWEKVLADSRKTENEAEKPLISAKTRGEQVTQEVGESSTVPKATTSSPEGSQATRTGPASTVLSTYEQGWREGYKEGWKDAWREASKEK
ncbi:hypothetical protein G7Z17_g5520 [Cylindrodendrum hubeiense]|uniref:Uncharacterized protein n=1 Tax=Cylindrodendrum hubeiense TaxID=595255 RepID=A0A9P5H6Z5_9HYPO|nr:hypothetical protein G7Z17_g5520 [Cylindrodendrum hubeiense]